MKIYIANLYKTIYNSEVWNKILIKVSENSFMRVLRSNGHVDNDWRVNIGNNCIPLSLSFKEAKLCSVNKKLYLPNELWEYIYKICLNMYSKDINIIFEYNYFDCCTSAYIKLENSDPNIEKRLEKPINLDRYNDYNSN